MSFENQTDEDQSVNETETKYAPAPAEKKSDTSKRSDGDALSVPPSSVRPPDLKQLFSTAVLSTIDDELPANPFDYTNLSGASGYSCLAIEFNYNNEVMKNDLRVLMQAASAGYHAAVVFDKSTDVKRQSPKTVINYIERKQLERLLKYLEKNKA